MHANRLGQQHWISLGVHQCGIKVLDVTQAVTPQGEGEGAVAQTVVTNVEGTLALEGRPGGGDGDNQEFRAVVSNA